MTYVVKNITDVTTSPKDIAIGDIPGVATITLKAGQARDLEVYATRNQIMDSSHLKVHISEGRVSVLTVSAQPDERLFVDATLRDGDGYALTSSDGYGGKRLLDVCIPRGVPQHFNGVVGVLTQVIAPSLETVAILVHNPSSNVAGTVLSVSFDGGVNFFDIERRASLELEANVEMFHIKGSAAGTNYQILVTCR